AADPSFLIGQPTVFIGKWPQTFRGDRPSAGKDRQLSPLRGDHLSLHSDMVTEIYVGLPLGKGFRTESVQAQHDLDFSATVPNRRETQLSADTVQHYPADPPDVLPRASVGWQFRVLLPDLGNRGCPRKAKRIRVGAALPEPVELLPPPFHLLGEIVSGLVVRRQLIVHDLRLSGAAIDFSYRVRPSYWAVG